MIPLELLPSLGEIVQDEAILADVKRNTEWIKITRGLLYFYGTVPHDKLVDLVEKYTPVRPDYLSFNYVIFDAMEYYQETYIDRYGFSAVSKRVDIHRQIEIFIVSLNRNICLYFVFCVLWNDSIFHPLGFYSSRTDKFRFVHQIKLLLHCPH